MFEVYVSNIGCICRTNDYELAYREFGAATTRTYQLGRYLNEAVHLFEDGELIKEHPAVEEPDSPNERD